MDPAETRGIAELPPYQQTVETTTPRTPPRVGETEAVPVFTSSPFTPVGNSTPCSSTSDLTNFGTPCASFASPASSGSFKLRKLGRPPIAISLGNNRSLSDGCIKDLFKRKRAEFESGSCSRSEETLEFKKPNFQLSPPVTHISTPLRPPQSISHSTLINSPSATSSFLSNMVNTSNNPSSDFQEVLNQLQQIRTDMSQNHQALEAKITSFQDTSQAEFNKLRGELQAEANKTELRFVDMRREFDEKYEKLSRNLAANTSSGSSNVLEPRIAGIETKLEACLALQPEKINNLLWKLERQERELRRNNIVIKGLPRTVTDLSANVESFLSSQFGLSGAFSSTREFGNDPLKSIVVTLNSFALKKSIMSSKNTLKGTKIFIDPDLTKEEYEIYKAVRAAAAPLKAKGRKVIINYSRYCLDGKWFYWNQARNTFIERNLNAPNSKPSAKPGASNHTSPSKN